MVSVALNDLFHDRTRLAMGLGGFLFAVVFTILAVGMANGTLRYATRILDSVDADIWAFSSKTSDFLTPPPFDASALEQVRNAPGVESASALVLTPFAAASAGGGEPQGIYLVAFERASGLGQSRMAKEGLTAVLDRDMTVLLDQSALRKLGALKVGDWIEVDYAAVEIVGFSRGATWMQGKPYAFTSVTTAERLLHWQGRASAGLVKVQRGADVSEVLRDLSEVPGIRALSREEVRNRLRFRLLAESPAGYVSGAMVAVGFLVGLMMVAIALYTATSARAREFAVLKAVGAESGYLYRLVLSQTAAIGVMGYVLGLAGGLALGRFYEDATGAYFSVPLPAMLATLLMVLVMSGAAAALAIRKVAGIEPSLAFRM